MGPFTKDPGGGPHRLYEQEQGRPLRSAPLGLYVRRWIRWTGAGVPAFTGCLGACP